MTHHFNTFDKSFGELPHLTCFAVKSCSNLAVLRLFSTLGGGADIVSGGELYRSLKAGIDPRRIIYSGVGKTEEELRYGLVSGILMFNVESEQELDRLQQVAEEQEMVAPVAFRINPDVDRITSYNVCYTKLLRIKLARKYSGEGRFEIISLAGSFHGRTLATVAATGQTRFHEGFEPLPAGFQHAEFGDITALEKLTSPQTCAILCEPLQGESGVRPLQKEYLVKIRQLCDDKGLLVITSYSIHYTKLYEG